MPTIEYPIRPCPACLSTKREQLFDYALTSGERQFIYSCLPCGMLFASSRAPIDYSHSIYESPGALGSGVSEFDQRRLDEVAATIERFCIKESVKLLDVGAGQGGLLAALERRGFGKQTGLDLSAACCQRVGDAGFPVINLPLDKVSGRFDFITLTHVLEHIEDVHTFLGQVRDHLVTFGRVYVEVPDAARYNSYSMTLPFLDLNSEHINHFSLDHLFDTLERCGFESISHGEKEITLTSGHLYPAVWCVAGRKQSALRMKAYIHNSSAALARANFHLEQSLGTENEIAIWGAGEYLAHVLRLPAVASRSIVAIVDRNPSLHGRTIAGCVVHDPSTLSRKVPLVIAALVAAPAIRANAEELGIETIIELEIAE